MKIIKIIPLIALVFLAACKSTVPQSEHLLEEHISPAIENSSNSEMSLNSSEKDSTVIFDRIKSYVYDSVITDMTTNFTVIGNICCSFGPYKYLSRCKVQYDSTHIHLNMISFDEKYQFNLNIENGIAFAQKKYNNYNQGKMNDLCAQHKSDSTKQNVACENNTITFTFKDDFSGYDLRNLGESDFGFECFYRISIPLCICDSYN